MTSSLPGDLLLVVMQHPKSGHSNRDVLRKRIPPPDPGTTPTSPSSSSSNTTIAPDLSAAAEVPDAIDLNSTDSSPSASNLSASLSLSVTTSGVTVSASSSNSNSQSVTTGGGVVGISSSQSQSQSQKSGPTSSSHETAVATSSPETSTHASATSSLLPLSLPISASSVPSSSTSTQPVEAPIFTLSGLPSGAPNLATSDNALPLGTDTPITTPTTSPQVAAASHGFMSNKSAVAGTFTVVALVIVAAIVAAWVSRNRRIHRQNARMTHPFIHDRTYNVDSYAYQDDTSSLNGPGSHTHQTSVELQSNPMEANSDGLFYGNFEPSYTRSGTQLPSAAVQHHNIYASGSLYPGPPPSQQMQMQMTSAPAQHPLVPGYTSYSDAIASGKLAPVTYTYPTRQVGQPGQTGSVYSENVAQDPFY